jgi:hypothetical protein
MRAKMKMAKAVIARARARKVRAPLGDTVGYAA